MSSHKAIGSRRVRAFMHPAVATGGDLGDSISVSPDAPLAEVALTMCAREVHRAIVVEDGIVVGVITSFDVLRAFGQGLPRTGQAIDYDPSA